MSDQATDKPAKSPEVVMAETIIAVLCGGTGGSVDVLKAAKLIAGFESAKFFTQHLNAADTFRSAKSLYDWALAQRKIIGLNLEFGVASGATLTQIALATSGKAYGFDGFTGLPEAWRSGYGEGAFARKDLPKVPSNAELVIGWFKDTLPGFVAAHPEPLSYLHVDCDLYSSTVDILTHLGRHIAPGTVVAFNDYFNYPGWQEHEHKAWAEWVAASGATFRYVACNVRHQQVIVIVDSNPTFAFPEKLRPLS